MAPAVLRLPETRRTLGASAPTLNWRSARAARSSLSSTSRIMERSPRRSGAIEPRLGTNPFCAGVPGPDGQNLMLLDMATTTIAGRGKARVAYNKGVFPVPDDCLIEADGTRRPNDLGPAISETTSAR